MQLRVNLIPLYRFVAFGILPYFSSNITVKINSFHFLNKRIWSYLSLVEMLPISARISDTHVSTNQRNCAVTNYQ